MKQEKKYSGVVVPMVSPFNDDFTIDRYAAANLCSKLVEAGCVPFVLGSTGEGVSMTLDQKLELVTVCARAIDGRSILYAGISGNSLLASIDETHRFANAGANVAVATLPFYYPIDNAQMLRYFTELANRSALPVILYNMPGMVKKSISVEVVEQLSTHPNIVGLKDSERDMNRHEILIDRYKDQHDFSFLIGWAAASVVGLVRGADGIVPSTGNITPELYQRLYEAARKGDMGSAGSLQETTNRISALYQEGRDLSNSISALKVFMATQGLCKPIVLPPLYRMEKESELAYAKEISEKIKELTHSR